MIVRYDFARHCNAERKSFGHPYLSTTLNRPVFTPATRTRAERYVEVRREYAGARKDSFHNLLSTKILMIPSHSTLLQASDLQAKNDKKGEIEGTSEYDLSCWGALKSLATPSIGSRYESVGSRPGILA